MDPLGANLAHIAAHQHIRSARPDAPVVADRASRRDRRRAPFRPSPARRATASALRRLADRLEPDHALP